MDFGFRSEGTDLAGPQQPGGTGAKHEDDRGYGRLREGEGARSRLPARLDVDEDSRDEEDRAHQQVREARRVDEPETVERRQGPDDQVAGAAAVGGFIGLSRESQLQRIGAGEDVGRQNRYRGDEVEELIGAGREAAPGSGRAGSASSWPRASSPANRSRSPRRTISGRCRPARTRTGFRRRAASRPGTRLRRKLPGRY